MQEREREREREEENSCWRDERNIKRNNSFQEGCNRASLPKGGFPLLRNFSVQTHVKFTRVNEIEAMYERPRVNVKVEPHSKNEK